MDNDALADSITKAIAYTENGGAPDIKNPKAGKTGEMKSIYQFQPNTWKQYSKEVFGEDGIEMNADTETHVVKQKVKKWIDKGYTASQIASMWNAGPSNPDAYKGTFADGSPSIKVHPKYKVKYDVPKYASSVLDYSKKFYAEKSGQAKAPAPQTAAVASPGSSASDFLKSLMVKKIPLTD